MRRSLWPYVISFLLVAIVIVVSWILCLANPTTTFLIVRHAERADASANTNLSQPGVERAAALAEVAREAGVTAVYSTDYCRTAQTAQPLATELGLPINIQPGGLGFSGCAPAIAVPTNPLPTTVNTPRALVDHILSEHGDEVVMIVGHSDTVPDIVAALGQGTFDPVSISSEFDNLFIVTVRRSLVEPRLVKARYGPCPMPPP